MSNVSTTRGADLDALTQTLAGICRYLLNHTSTTDLQDLYGDGMIKFLTDAKELIPELPEPQTHSRLATLCKARQMLAEHYSERYPEYAAERVKG